MKLVYKEFKKAIFNENNEICYYIKKKWMTKTILDCQKVEISTTYPIISGKIGVSFNGNLYAGKQKFWTNAIEFGDGDIVIEGNNTFFSSCYSCIIKRNGERIAIIRQKRESIFKLTYEIEIFDQVNEKFVLAFLFPALKTLTQTQDSLD